MSTFGERLKDLRKSNGLTQEQLAKIFYLNKSSISRYENDVQLPENDLLQKIADYFNVSLDYIMARTDTANSIVITKTTSAISKKEIRDHDEFMSEARAMFMNGEVADEDKEKIFKDISDLFWESKKINKEKYGKKK
ncbi:MAG: helix-turn-helix domain-containing protein [Bacilli bacterium]